MISKLSLKNYKSHTDTQITFDPVTTFVGENNAGKSSGVWEPLYIVLTNTKFPSTWINWNADQAEIEITLNDKIIKRTRNKKTSVYEVGGRKLTGTRGLEEILAEATGFRKVIIDEAGSPEDINFVPAKSRPFILDRSAEGIRRRLVGILRLNELEAARTKLSSRLKTLNTEYGNLTARHSELAERSENRSKQIEILIEISDIEKLKESLQETLAHMEKFDGESIRVLPQEVDDRLQICSYLIDKFSQINLPSLDGLSSKVIALEGLFRYTSTVKDLVEIVKDKLEIERELSDLELKIGEIKTCPECGQPI